MNLYGRRITPTFQEAEELPPPYQPLTKNFEPPPPADDSSNTSEVFWSTTTGASTSDSEGVADGGESVETVATEEYSDEGEGGIVKTESALSWESTQAIKYRLAQKRSMRDAELILRSEVAKAGLVEGTRVSARTEGPNRVYHTVLTSYTALHSTSWTVELCNILVE